MHEKDLEKLIKKHFKSFNTTDELSVPLPEDDRLTVEVQYHMPDYKKLLNTFTWQFLDISPSYPRLCSFITHWQKNIEADINTVHVWCASAAIIPNILALQQQNILEASLGKTCAKSPQRWWELGHTTKH